MDISRVNEQLQTVLDEVKKVRKEQVKEKLNDQQLSKLTQLIKENSKELENLHSSTEIHVGNFDHKIASDVSNAVSELLDIQSDEVGFQGSQLAPMLFAALAEFREAVNKNLDKQHKRGERVAKVDESGLE